MADTRIYVVINRTTGEKRLVEAMSQSQAIRHCVTPVYYADVATAKVVADLCTTGKVTIEHATTTTHTTTTQEEQL